MEECGPGRIERRQAKRESKICLQDAELILMYDGALIELLQFKDVSPFGICLLASEVARKDTVITIRYQNRKGQFEVLGKMVWQEPEVLTANDNRHWIGINFDPHRQAQNLALFESITHPLKSLIVQNYTDQNVITLSKEMDIASAVAKLLQSSYAGAPVIDKNKRVIGFVSEQDCIQKMQELRYTAESQETVASMMKNNVLTINLHDSIVELAEQMVRDKPKIYPVVDDEQKLIGIITRRDVLRALDHYFHAVRQ